MLREAIIEFMREYPNVKISHSLFSPDEFLVMRSDGNVYDENGYLFEDWESDHNGMRMRTGGSWETDWYVIKSKENCKILLQTESGREYLYSNCHQPCQDFHGDCVYSQEVRHE